jgi:hypothetical protein
LERIRLQLLDGLSVAGRSTAFAKLTGMLRGRALIAAAHAR